MVLSIALSQNALMFLTTGDDKKIMHCSVGDGAYSIVRTLTSEGVGVALCQNDRLAVACDGGMVVVHDLFKNEKKTEFYNPMGGIGSLASVRDGSSVLIGTTVGYLREWSTADNKFVHEFDIDETGQIIALAIAPDGSRAACGLSDGQVALLDLAKAKAIKTRLANGRVNLADLVKAKAIKKWKAHAGRVNVVAFAPDGELFASFGDDYLGRVWSATNGAPGAKLTGHQGPILGAGWCADGQRIVTAGIDKKVHLWTASTGKMHEWAPTTKEKVYSLAVDPQDRFVLAGQSDGIVQLFPLPPKE
jgi:WD40 repeat protein